MSEIIKNMSEIIKNNWNSKSNEYFQRDLDCYDEIIKNPERAFPINLYPLIQKYISDLRGKKVCVPSSGDNIAAFGFHLLGAKVTSCDIAENQLKNAKIIADKYNFNGIEFICQDSMKLEKIKDNEAANQKYNWTGDTFDWHVNPWAALPQCLCLCSQK